jgi:methylated-DNA-[protein]-cysteine S-methyltransferase
MNSFQKRVVKEDKSSSSPFAAARVYEVVKKIPKGRVLTYKEVAKLAGSTRAWRVVGNVLNKNYDPKIPCHRVIRGDGKVGGYRYGVKRKIALLKREGIIIDSYGEVTSRFKK